MSIEACADLVKGADPDRFLSVMAAKPNQRDPLFILYAFNIEISRAPWVTAEPMIAEMRLQWWCDGVAEIAQGRPVRTHEVATPLANLVGQAEIPTDVLDQMISARSWDIYSDAFKDQAQFDRYIDHTAGHLMWLSALCLGAGPDHERRVRDYAYGAGVANLLRAASTLEARGRKPLVDGTHDGIRRLATSALQGIRNTKKSDIPKAIRPALWAGWQADLLLKRAVKDPASVSAGRLSISEFRKKAGLLRRSFTSSL